MMAWFWLASRCLLAALPTGPATATLTVDPSVTLNSFVPRRVLGAGVDGHECGAIATIYTAHNLSLMKSAGLRPLTYRLRTELACESWHWNPEGSWSDPTLERGYWTSSDKPSRKIETCYGYRLPRRGNTIDQANDDGYSRIDDGDPATFWKSNPYLDPRFTGDPEDRDPQWIVVDLGRPRPVDALCIDWANPYATRYRVEYWEGKDAIMINENPPGRWLPLPKGDVGNGRGGHNQVLLGRPKKGSIRFLRIELLRSSHTAEPSSHPDPRDAMGFAIREIEVGRERSGKIQDLLVHRRDNSQTPIYVSSTDPWHRANDLDPRVEQPGFDRVFESGLTNGQPLMAPVPVLYDTPDNAVAEIKWLKRRHYPINRIEMGEEPDGQLCSPEHYVGLYAPLASRLKAVAPEIDLGGPCFQSTITDVMAWPRGSEKRSWMRRFTDELARKGCLSSYRFFSFEWYPFDDTGRPPTPQLQANARLLEGVLRRLQKDGLSRRIPWFVTEYGYSAFAGPPEVDLPGAILNLDAVAKFLELGGAGAYLYGYEPEVPISEKRGLFGNLMILEADGEGIARWRLPAYWGAWLMTHAWCTQDDRPHRLVKCRIANDDQGYLSAYSVARPDGLVSTLVLNKSSSQSVRVKIEGRIEAKGEVYRYGRAEYAWHADGENGSPMRSLPPHRGRFAGQVLLPPFSITVLLTRTARS